jgi:hypothetical protein
MRRLKLAFCASFLTHEPPLLNVRKLWRCLGGPGTALNSKHWTGCSMSPCAFEFETQGSLGKEGVRWTDSPRDDVQRQGCQNPGGLSAGVGRHCANNSHSSLGRSSQEYTPRDINGRSKRTAESARAGHRALEPSCSYAEYDDRRERLWSALLAGSTSWEVEPNGVSSGSSGHSDCRCMSGRSLLSVSSDWGALPLR